MKKLINPEFKFCIQNLLSSEEHMIDMLTSKNAESIIPFLRKTKLQRNILLDFLEEKDRNKWCALKHLMLSQYHILELINSQQDDIDVNKLNATYKELEVIINDYIKQDIEADCNICTRDLIIDKVKSSFFKKGK